MVKTSGQTNDYPFHLNKVPTFNTCRHGLIPSSFCTLGLVVAIKFESVVTHDRTLRLLLVIIRTSDKCIIDISEAPITAIVTDDIGWIDASGNLINERAIVTCERATALYDFAAKTNENTRALVNDLFITSDHATWES